MPPQQAEELLSGAVTAKLDSAEIEKAKLSLQVAIMMAKLKKLLDAKEMREIELEATADNGMPPTKAFNSGTRVEIMDLLRELGEEYNINQKPISEAWEKIWSVEKRINSLEAIISGKDEQN